MSISNISFQCDFGGNLYKSDDGIVLEYEKKENINHKKSILWGIWDLLILHEKA